MRIADDPAYAVAIDTDRKLIDVAVIGHWSPTVIARFEAALRDAVARLPALGIRPGEQVALFDTTRFLVQSPAVLDELNRIATDPRVTSRRIALVLASALLRLQAKRVLPHLPVFDRRETALAWLTGDAPPPG